MLFLPLVSGADTEVVAVAVLVILTGFTLRGRPFLSSRPRIFLGCCVLAIVAILVNVLTLMAEALCETLPRVLVAGVNTAYFILMPMAELAACVYVLTETYAGVEQRRGLHQIVLGICAAYAVFLALVVTNGLHGLLFVLDGKNHYFRGGASWLNPLLAGVGIGICLLCHLRHRREEERSLRSAMRVLPLLALLLALLQFLIPQVQLAGTAIALTMLVLFICCQRQQVYSDSLTGAGSRDAFIRELEMLAAQHSPCLVQLVSLRGFKQINRRYGQLTGDRLLQHVTTYLKLLYKEDHVYRLSGVEFVVLHPHGTTSVSQARFAQLQERFRQAWKLSGSLMELRAVFVSYESPALHEDPDAVITGLEYCVRRAREQGSGSLVMLDEHVRKEVKRRDHLQEVLQSALDQDWFRLCYQPIYDAASETICSAEVLLRLRTPEGEEISPGEFIPLAELNGMIIPLTWRVVDMVCRFIQETRELALPPLSVNFSTQQFMDEDMPVVLKRYLRHYGVKPSALKVEITERMVSEDAVLLRRTAAKLESMGVGLYLDDFGTGYSNLAGVGLLPFEVIKVDKSLLDSSCESHKANVLLSAIFSGLKEMGVQILMEGVETADQVAYVKSIGASRLQGYYYARPLEKDAFLQLIEKARAEKDAS